MPSRRRYLAGVGALAAFGGCSALTGPDARMSRLRVENRDSTARDVAVTLSLDGETVYEETHSLPADDEDGSAVELTDELPDEGGRLVVESAVKGAGFSESSTYEDDNCYDLIVEFTGENLIHWQNEDADGCE